MKNYISIDIGGTAIKYGIINENSEILYKNQTQTEAHMGGNAILEKIFNIVYNFIEKYEISGICISTAGMVDTNEGKILYASSLIPNYTGTEIKKSVEQKFNIKCEVENDVNCAGIAEYNVGASKGSNVSVCITVGTGIGGCIISGGKIFSGANGIACEIGYMNIDNSTFQDIGASSVLSKKVSDIKNIPIEECSGIEIFSQAKNGDSVCINAIDDMVDVLAKGIANICYVINPDVVVLGGGIMEQKEYLEPRLNDALDKYLIPIIRNNTKIKFAMNKNDAGIIGAYYNFIQKTGV